MLQTKPSTFLVGIQTVNTTQLLRLCILMRCKMCGVLILREHTCTCSSVVLHVCMTVKTVMYECVKYTSLLNILKGICCDGEQYAYCTNSRGTKARSWSWSSSWSCHPGLDLGLGLVSFGLGLVVLVLVLVLVLRI